MSVPETDVIDALAGIAPGSPLLALRAQRPQARENAQRSYRALFHPGDPDEASLAERHAVAMFVAGLHRQPDIATFYAAGLEGHADLRPHLETEVARGATHGPYGRFPAGPLSREDSVGPAYRVDEAARPALGPRLSAALEHAHLLVFHPRDAHAPALQALLDAGWSNTGIVTLSQLIAFLSFQIRVIAGLRSLAAAPAIA
jgi:CMD domain protein